MTDMTMSDEDLGDTPMTDLAPFFRRYDRRQRIVFVAALCVTLVASTVIATHVIDSGGLRGRPALGVWGFGVSIPPAFTVLWWSFAEFMVRQRRRTEGPDGRHPAGPIDARNGMRIANGGFVFNIGLLGTVIVQQALIAMMVFGYPPVGFLIPRLIVFTVGGLTIYLGNLWPKMPAPRTAGRSGAVLMKANRFSGWLMVTVGVLMILFGLCLPLVIPVHRP